MMSKSIKLQLLSSVAMCLVALLCLGSATYAWFAQNSVVEASSVSVTAQTAENLSISLTNNGTDWATTVALESPSSHFWPVSVSEGTKAIGTLATATLTQQDGATFYIIKNNNKVLSANNKAATTTFNDATLADSALLSANFTEITDGSNYWTDDIYLRYEYTDAETSPINAEITVVLPKKLPDGTTDMSEAALKIEKAYHIAFATEDKKWTNLDLSTATYTAASGEEPPYLTCEVSNLLTLTANVPQLIKVYSWYEGEDTDCFTNNAVAPNTLTTAFKFSLPNNP